MIEKNREKLMKKSEEEYIRNLEEELRRDIKKARKVFETLEPKVEETMYLKWLTNIAEKALELYIRKATKIKFR